MTEDRLPLTELLAKAGDGDFLRSVAEAVVQLLMETDVEGLIGAERHERTAERATYRNGYRDWTLDTRPGSCHADLARDGLDGGDGHILQTAWEAALHFEQLEQHGEA